MRVYESLREFTRVYESLREFMRVYESLNEKKYKLKIHIFATRISINEFENS